MSDDYEEIFAGRWPDNYDQNNYDKYDMHTPLEPWRTQAVRKMYGECFNSRDWEDFKHKIVTMALIIFPNDHFVYGMAWALQEDGEDEQYQTLLIKFSLCLFSTVTCQDGKRFRRCPQDEHLHEWTGRYGFYDTVAEGELVPAEDILNG